MDMGLADSNLAENCGKIVQPIPSLFPERKNEVYHLVQNTTLFVALFTRFAYTADFWSILAHLSYVYGQLKLSIAILSEAVQ